MNSLCHPLYDVYTKKKSTKKLWDALEQKYENGDGGWKKLLISRLFEFKMVENKPFMKQVTDLQLLFQRIHVEG